MRRGPYLLHPHPRHHHHYMDHSDTEQEDEDTSSDEEERPLREAPSFSFLSVCPPTSAFSGGQADSPLPPPLPCETIPVPNAHPHDPITATSPAQGQGQSGISSGGRAGTGTGTGPYARIDELVAERRAREREGGTPSTAISSSSGHGERMEVAPPAGESEEEGETARGAAPSQSP